MNLNFTKIVILTDIKMPPYSIYNTDVRNLLNENDICITSDPHVTVLIKMCNNKIVIMYYLPVKMFRSVIKLTLVCRKNK